MFFDLKKISVITIAGHFFLMVLAAFTSAAPTIRSVSPRGLQSGATTALTIVGENLSPNMQIILPGARATAKPRSGGSATQIQIDVAVPAETSAGFYELRMSGSTGVSNSITIGVDPLPQKPFSATIERLPVALHGSLSGSAIVKTQFTGNSGQKIVIEIEARRLGSTFAPVLHLYDDRGVQLAWSQGKSSIGGDARISATLPSTGRYTVALHDRLYRAASGLFRLKIGSFSYADGVFPIGVQRGKKIPLEPIHASFASGSTIPFSGDVMPGWRPVSLPSEKQMCSGSRPRVFISLHDEIVEQPKKSGEYQVLSAAPVAINGRISADGQEDRFRLPVTPGSRIRLETIAAEVGSDLDAVLSVLGKDGKVLATSDDRGNTTDPAIDFTVPAGVTSVFVSMRDLLGSGGAAHIYRVAITPAGQPQFDLSFSAEHLSVPTGGKTLLKVTAKRTGYNGPIKLDLLGLSRSSKLSGNEIASGSTTALIVIEGTPLHGMPYITRVRGVAATNETIAAESIARRPLAGRLKSRPWVAERLLIGRSELVSTDVDWETSVGKNRLLAGSTTSLPVRISSLNKQSGSVRLSLLTTQSIPQKTVNKKQVVDLARALRIAAPVTVTTNARVSNLNVIVPADLPAREYDVVIKAERLSADGKQVVSVNYSTVRRITTATAITVQLKSGASITAVAGAGAAGIFSGEVVRDPKVIGSILVELVGLPKGYTSARVTLPDGATRFDLPVRFSDMAKPTDLKNIKLVASVMAGEKQLARSAPIGVMIKVVSGKK